jgi:hypothetical protein
MFVCYDRKITVVLLTISSRQSPRSSRELQISRRDDVMISSSGATATPLHSRKPFHPFFLQVPCVGTFVNVPSRCTSVELLKNKQNPRQSNLVFPDILLHRAFLPLSETLAIFVSKRVPSPLSLGIKTRAPLFSCRSLRSDLCKTSNTVAHAAMVPPGVMQKWFPWPLDHDQTLAGPSGRANPDVHLPNALFFGTSITFCCLKYPVPSVTSCTTCEGWNGTAL